MPLRALEGRVQIVYPFVEVAALDAALGALRVDLDAEGYAFVHGDRERLGAAHAAEARGEADAASEGFAEA